MDYEKTGSLIRRLRMEKEMTQRELAGQLHVSDRAVSKWERGQGCPDVSMLPGLSQILDVDTGTLLSGEMDQNKMNGGNMKQIRFYCCPVCGNLLTSAGKAEISCCGRKLEPLKPRPADEAHRPQIQIIEDEYFITFEHEMTKEHYIYFAAYLRWDSMLLIRLYPEQEAQVRIPARKGGRLYFGCSSHGLWEWDGMSFPKE